MKKLIIVTHPDIKSSKINRRWLKELKKYPEEFTVHSLYEMYPDGQIDIEKEQTLVSSHESVILQFPLYWFSSPPLLKKWLDEVLLHDWAYGSNGDKIKGKKFALAISAGIKKEDYAPDGRYKVTIEELTIPFATTFRYTKSDYRPFFAFYGAEDIPEDQAIDQSAVDYLKFARAL